jgi:hypothetical protein
MSFYDCNHRIELKLKCSLLNEQVVTFNHENDALIISVLTTRNETVRNRNTVIKEEQKTLKA